MTGTGVEGRGTGEQRTLQQGLKMCHMTMISLGGVIGVAPMEFIDAFSKR